MLCQKSVWLDEHGRLHLHLQLHLISLYIWLSDVGIHTCNLIGALAVGRGGGCQSADRWGIFVVPDMRVGRYLQIEGKRTQG